MSPRKPTILLSRMILAFLRFIRPFHVIYRLRILLCNERQDRSRIRARLRLLTGFVWSVNCRPTVHLRRGGFIGFVQ